MRRTGRARVDCDHPEAFGVCDRCYMLYNRRNLHWQWNWVGGYVAQNLRVLVCDDCYDKPTDQRKPLVLPPDPMPRKVNRPEQNYAIDAPSGLAGFPIGLLLVLTTS